MYVKDHTGISTNLILRQEKAPVLVLAASTQQYPNQQFETRGEGREEFALWAKPKATDMADEDYIYDK